MKRLIAALLGAASMLAASQALSQTKLTIATVNNGDMIRMQGLTEDFTKANPDIKLKWVTLEENVLRQRVTTDIATKGGQFDVLTIGTYEVPIWAKKGWLVPLDKLGADYDVDDLLPAIRPASRSTASSTPRRSTARARWSCTARTCSTRPASRCRTRPTWDFVGRRRPQDHRQDDRGLRHLPARQGRLGREHGLPDGHCPTPSARAGSTRTGSRSSTSPSGRTRSTSTST